ncbi:putative MATE family efflux protein [Breznakia sp. PF5-3]|uniref:MATE family efflux transporter n=1 Tax=unclassified Breznakia TaxID=2623764 RepID=UPI002404D3E7|nr:MULTISPECIES: MATE family efflux transporter [unclassified Breznakia]MDL2276562.1 MATE family efflux transporter [Breznakia sp. OttesenSCG-928-G09]MDF9825492.1 putative MATE family efflux protein [Breznakia sp. PM6-1]MDF9836338.1 putative MATE family efflux protein [Breznakia sp. PF5-3]MDF9838186.1 putative MATE family efflux protein [Breznakia sp. PFB2-8]MDF9860221.1 putative MATE family efflux protein [Breznakia sp. PH5-24]
MSRVKDMTHGNPTKLIIMFAIPLILGNLGQQLYMIIDAIIVGQGVGVTALASLGATDWTYWLLLWIIQAFTQGCAIRITQDFGSKNNKRLKKSIAMSILICGVVTLFVTVLGLVAGRPLLELLNTPDNLLDGALTYLYIMVSGSIVVVCYNMTSSILRAFGDSKTPLIAMAIAAVTNIALDLLFVMVLGWGIAGAAFATVIAQFIASLYCFVIIKKLKFIKLHKEDREIESFVIKDLLKLSSPLVLQHIVIAVGGMVLQSVINKYGFLFVAGFTATNKLYGLLESSAVSFGYASTTFTAQNWGAKKIKRIKAGLTSSTKLSLIVSLMISVFMIIFGKPLLQLFIANDANSSKVLDIAYQYLFIMSLLLSSLYMLYTYRCTLQGLGNTVAPMISGFIEFVMRIGSALLLPMIMGSLGIFFAEVTAWIGAMIYLMYACLSSIKEISETYPDEPKETQE